MSTDGYKRINGSKVKQYYVTRGAYAVYSYTQANCATFVRDALNAAMPDRVKAVNNGKLNSSWTPSSVFNFAKKL